jgi:hypothetical protein
VFLLRYSLRSFPALLLFGLRPHSSYEVTVLGICLFTNEVSLALLSWPFPDLMSVANPRSLLSYLYLPSIQSLLFGIRPLFFRDFDQSLLSNSDKATLESIFSLFSVACGAGKSVSDPSGGVRGGSPYQRDLKDSSVALSES